jgi:hypothetical protein
MTVGAGFGHGKSFELTRTGTAMGLVAVTAGKLSLLDRMGVGLEGLTTNLLMATITDVRLESPLQDSILGVNIVAVSAGEIRALVLTAVPE